MSFNLVSSDLKHAMCKTEIIVLLKKESGHSF